MQKNEVNKIMEIINSPLYGVEFYDRKTLLRLCSEVLTIKHNNLVSINEDDSTMEKIRKIKEYVINNGVGVRTEYFEDFKGKKDFIYRTSYAALIKKNAICIGYAELVRILLNLYGVKAYTMLATLPYRAHPAIHYFNVAEIVNELGTIQYMPIDVEREVSRRKKGDNLEEYFEKMTITFPTNDWFKNKIGDWGMGIHGEDYLEKMGKHKYLGMSQLPKLMEDYKRYLMQKDKEKYIVEEHE